jgi:hypothetical protein
MTDYLFPANVLLYLKNEAERIVTTEGSLRHFSVFVESYRKIILLHPMDFRGKLKKIHVNE